MKPLVIVLALLLATPSAALAQGPLTSQARAEVMRQYSTHPGGGEAVAYTGMEHPLMFWIGVGMVAIGLVAVVASTTWERDSDLSEEYRNVRLGRDLAPCGTDPKETALPIADCQMNNGLFWAGTGIAGIGTGLMFYGGRQTQYVRPYPSVRWSVRF